MTKQYLKYLIESIAYSFEDDESNTPQEEFAFSKRKIGDVVDILTNAGPVVKKPVINIDEEKRWLEFPEIANPVIEVLQWYRNWWFDEMYRIFYIQYYLSVDGTELVQFTIESKDKVSYDTLYNFSTGTFVQHKSLRMFSKGDKLFRYRSIELKNTILDIINQIKNCHV